MVEGTAIVEEAVMATVTASAERVVQAAPAQVYALLADYREGRPRLLPDSFRDYRVEAGGTGALDVVLERGVDGFVLGVARGLLGRGDAVRHVGRPLQYAASSWSAYWPAQPPFRMAAFLTRLVRLAKDC
jgi:hypothetical protein